TPCRSCAKTSPTTRWSAPSLQRSASRGEWACTSSTARRIFARSRLPPFRDLNKPFLGGRYPAGESSSPEERRHGPSPVRGVGDRQGQRRDPVHCRPSEIQG